MSDKFCVSLTYSKDDTDKATVAFVIANAALGSEKDTMVFLSTEGVRRVPSRATPTISTRTASCP